MLNNCHLRNISVIWIVNKRYWKGSIFDIPNHTSFLYYYELKVIFQWYYWNCYLIHWKYLERKREEKEIKPTVLTLKIECIKATIGCCNSKSIQFSYKPHTLPNLSPNIYRYCIKSHQWKTSAIYLKEKKS
jgi:hypothetical protein